MTSPIDTGEPTNGDDRPVRTASPAAPERRPNPGQTEIDRPRNQSRDDNELRLVLDPTTAAPRLARRAVSQWQSVLDLDDQLTDDVLVVVTELVTNAVRHARSPSEVIATLDDEVLRLEVHDLGTEPPVLRPPDGTMGGYGLRFVAGLTDRWGWRPTTTGKYVWTETDCASRLPGRWTP